MTLLQCASLHPPPPSSCLSSSTHLSLFLPSLRGFLDAEQTQCSLCKITRLINANKQTALRQPQMKANLYAINRGRSSFNLPVRPARCCCSTPPPLPPSSASPAPSLSSSSLTAFVLPISVLTALLGWAQRQGKLTDASIIHRSPPLSLCLSLVFSPLALRYSSSPLQCSVFTGTRSDFREESRMLKQTMPRWMQGWKDGLCE